MDEIRSDPLERQEPTVLKINMTGFSEKGLEAVVAERCAAFGIVKKLRVYLPRKGSSARPFVLVDMETPEQAARLAAATSGRLTIDSAVIIFLVHERHCASVLIRGRHGFDNSAIAYPSLIIE